MSSDMHLVLINLFMLCNNCLLLLTLGVVAIGVVLSRYTHASLLRLKSIIGCSRNTRLGKFPAFHCIWKHIANSTVQPKESTPNWKGVNFSLPRVQHC